MTTVEPGASEVLTHGLRSRPRSHGVAGEQAGADHHRWVGGVGAAGDRRDHDPAVVELEGGAVVELDLDCVLADPRREGRRGASGRPPRLAALVFVVLGRRVRGGEGLFARLVDAVAHLLSGLGVELLHRLEEGLLGVGQRHPVLGPLGAGDAGGDVAEVELEHVGEDRVGRPLLEVHALLAGVGVDQLEGLGGPAGQLEIAQRLRVDREDRAGRAELRRHVADRRPVGEAQSGQARAEELDELGDDAALAQHLGHGQHQVGRGGAVGEPAVELEADDLGQQHRDRLAEHRRLGLDPADPPAEDAEAVDHGRVRVGADQGVGVGLQDAVALAAVDDLGDVLEVDLVADPCRRRHDAEVVEGLATPLEERVALAVAFELALGVEGEGALVAEGVDLHRVVDDQVDVDQRVDLLRIAADLRHRVAHRRQVDDRGDAGEVLHQDPCRLEGDLDARRRGRVPAGDRLDVGVGDRGAVLEAEDVLEQDLDRVGQARDLEALGERVEPEDLVGAATHLEGRTGAEGVAAHVLIL